MTSPFVKKMMEAARERSQQIIAANEHTDKPMLGEGSKIRMRGRPGAVIVIQRADGQCVQYILGATEGTTAAVSEEDAALLEANGCVRIDEHDGI